MAPELYPRGIFDVPSGKDVNPNADKRVALYWTSSVFAFFMLLSVILRFVSRKVAKIPLKLDDWLILAAVPFALVTNGVNIFGPTHNGQGRHINHSTPKSLKRFYQATYVFLIAYNIAIALAKYSLIYFYRRILSTDNFKLPLLSVTILTTCWLIGCSFAAIFGCIPISGYWTLNSNANCIDERSYYTGQTASNMLLDVILLIIPIFAISRLHMSRSHKIAVSGIFALGIFVTICSAVRLGELIKIQQKAQFDFTYDIVEAAVWSVIENNVGIVCACLPTLRPLLRLVMNGSAQTSSGSRQQSYGRQLDSRNAINGPFSPLESSRGSKALHNGKPSDWEDRGYEARVYVGNGHDNERGESNQEFEMLGRDTERAFKRGSQEDIKIDTDVVTWYETRRTSMDTPTGSEEGLKKLEAEPVGAVGAAR